MWHYTYFYGISLHMINYTSQFQLKFDEFSSLYQLQLDPLNRWIQLSSILPWDMIVKKWVSHYSIDQGAAGINPRILIGAVIIKHKLLSLIHI